MRRELLTGWRVATSAASGVGRPVVWSTEKVAVRPRGSAAQAGASVQVASGFTKVWFGVAQVVPVGGADEEVIVGGV